MTEEILSLIRSKNRCLEQLMNATRSLLAESTESLAIGSDKNGVNPLDAYDLERGAAIRTLELYDRKLSELISGLTPAMKTAEFIEDVKSEMQKNELLLISVFNADDIVFKKISDAQAKIQILIGENRKNRETLTKFKSTWVNPSGEELDSKL